LRIAVADDERDMRQFFQELLPPLGHEVVAVAESGRRLVEQCRATRPDLVITDIKMPDLDGLTAAALVNQDRAVPVILVTAHPEVDVMASAGSGHVMAYLTKPVKPVDLQAAISLAVLRFEQFRQLSQEAADLRQALEDRKVIERAKGVVMRQGGLNEDEAFHRLQRLACDHNRPLVEAARIVLAAEEAFQPTEGRPRGH
jgi:response regulator NasT